MSKTEEDVSVDVTESEDVPEGLISLSEALTESIDIDTLFTKDVTSSGSFDLRHARNMSFARLLAALPIPTFIIDSSFKIVFCNEAAVQSREEASPQQEIQFASLFPSFSERNKIVAIIVSVFQDRKTKIYEGVVKIREKFRWCRMHFRSIRFRRERLILAIVEDLTSEKKQLMVREKYQQLVEMFPIGIAEFVLESPVSIADPLETLLTALSKARLIGGNREFARMYGSSDIAELEGKLFKSLPATNDQYGFIYRTWAKAGFPIRIFETLHVWPTGHSGFLENTLVGNLKRDRLHGFWLMHQDITHRKEVEDALVLARDSLEERVRERTAELLRTNEQLLLEVREREKAEKELGKLVVDLQNALSHVKSLTGLLPICASCKKIRDDKGYWTQVEVYMQKHSELEFTHGICPECFDKLYPELHGPKKP